MKKLLKTIGQAQADLAKACQVSTATISLLIAKGQWPKRNPEQLRGRIRAFFLDQGVDAEVVDAAMPELKTGEEAATSTPASLQNPINSNAMEDSMLLQNETLTPAARKHFRLIRNPFADDITSLDDVFMSPDIRFCREAMWDVARNGGFCAVVGESGSGKTTLREEMHERIKRENAPVIVIEPYVLAMEDNDIKGKTLKSSQVAEAIIRTLDPSATPKRTPEARFRQLHDLLKASYKSGNTHVLIIEEAHSLPIATLKHLKRFREMKDGFARLLGVILIGQPELKIRLSAHNPEVREVVQRCEVVELGPLDRHVEGYVKHKLQRASVKVEEIFDQDAFDAIRMKLTRSVRGSKPSDAVSICYPLVVNNLIARAMNNAATIAAPKINSELIMEAA
ncbi:type II secretory pathway predicted ATPase ExeA [Paucimonas lemoignei]|uniref:Type II secretory pathway predicted ATPase ExeA n=1 Tax=Paucimonas lemoignei TaxID=29443 RepID=A0A4R3HZ33_PAULE|nr:AAA family ATPase [Paucimonas lemoignei]TCS38498.1 type II secretory pathway predicted ATPase ExeA [Paucimonas lemoignei]